MSWDYFALFAIVALLFWGLGAFAAWRGKRPVVVYTLTCLGLAVFFSFIVGMWISLVLAITGGDNIVMDIDLLTDEMEHFGVIFHHENRRAGFLGDIFPLAGRVGQDLCFLFL